MEQVQDEYLKVKRVSAHLLKVFKQSIKEYLNKLNNPEQEHKKYFELGKQVHMQLLEPDKFNQMYLLFDFDTNLTPSTEQQKLYCYAFVPHDATSDEKIASDIFKKIYKTERKSPKKVEEEAIAMYNRYKPYIQYLRELNTGKIVLPKNLTDSLNKAKTTILEHKKASELLATPEIEFADDQIKYYNELEIMWEFKAKEGLVECKSKPDRVIIDMKNKVIKLVDLKTTSNLIGFNESIKDFGYDLQLSFYWLALTYWFLKEFPNEKIEEYKQETYIVAYKTVGLPECKVFSLSTNLLNNTLTEITNLLDELSWHIKENKWDYSRTYYEGDGVEIIS